MEYRRRVMPWALMILGALMALSALFMLGQTPNVLQYTALAPQAGDGNANINEKLDKAQEVWEAQHANYAWMTLGGGNSRVRASNGMKYEEVNLVAMGEGWLEV